LLLLITPIIAQADINENKNPLNKGDCDLNSLGNLTVVHIPMWIGYLQNHGIGQASEYNPPDDNPLYDYYFCEINGKVYMNFTLSVKHRLNDANGFFISDRYTWINKIWISGDPDGTDYFAKVHKQECTDVAWEEYCIELTEGEQIEPLETNGEEKTIKLWIDIVPAITHNELLHNFMLFLPAFPLRLAGPIDLTIHPVQC
jgi:hypothetical protein